LEFESAEAGAALQQSPAGAEDQTSGAESGSDGQRLAKSLAETNDRTKQLESQIEALNKQIESAHGKKRQDLISQRDTQQGALDLNKALQDALQKIPTSVNMNGGNKSELQKDINQLKQSVPEVFATKPQSQPKVASSSPSAKTTRAENSGLVGQLSILFGQTRDLHDIDQLISETKDLREMAAKLRAPLVDTLRTLVQQGQDAMSQQANGTAPPENKHDLEQLTARFKQISAAAVPLREEMSVLDQCRAELLEWRSSMLLEYRHVLRLLLTRVAGLFIALGGVFSFGVAPRTAIFTTRDGAGRSY
jgi:chromosome segregation ATPase